MGRGEVASENPRALHEPGVHSLAAKLSTLAGEGDAMDFPQRIKSFQFDWIGTFGTHQITTTCLALEIRLLIAWPKTSNSG